MLSQLGISFAKHKHLKQTRLTQQMQENVHQCIQVSLTLLTEAACWWYAFECVTLLLQIFLDIWRHRELHPQLLKLLAMWNGIFPKQLLDVLQRTVKQTSLAQPSGRQIMSSTQYHAYNQPAQQEWRPAAAPYPSYTAEPASTSGRDLYAAVQQQNYGPRGLTPPEFVQFAATGHGYPAYANVTGQGGAVQQPWQYQLPAHQRPDATSLPSSCQPLVLPSLLSSLISSGLLTAQQPVPSAAVSVLPTAPAVSYAQPGRAATPEFVDPEDAKIVPSRLKVLSCPLPLLLCSFASWPNSWSTFMSNLMSSLHAKMHILLNVCAL